MCQLLSFLVRRVYLAFFAGSWRRWGRGWAGLREMTEKSERFLWVVYDQWRWNKRLGDGSED